MFLKDFLQKVNQSVCAFTVAKRKVKKLREVITTGRGSGCREEMMGLGTGA
jgi:hypothetical protein